MIHSDGGLEKYYPGDKKWRDFVSVFEDKWTNSKLQIELLNALNDKKDLAIVIYGIMTIHCLNYLNARIPALGQLTPLECLQNKTLIKRLRVCLMRTH